MRVRRKIVENCLYFDTTYDKATKKLSRLQNITQKLYKVPQKFFSYFLYRKSGKPNRIMISYKFGFSGGHVIRPKGQEERSKVIAGLTLPEYYFSSIMYPGGNKLTKKMILDFILVDLLEKEDFYTALQGYESIGQLRGINLRFLY